MKVSVLLNVFLAAAVAVLAVAKFAPESSSKTDNPVIDNIMTRTSIRAYETKKVEEKKIEVMLRAAMAAPTAINSQPWDFVVVDDSAKLKEQNWIADASAATENLLLAAHSLGLGAVWTGVYPSEHRVSVVRGVLGLPEYVVPLSLIPVGYPAESPKPKDKWKPENVHRNGWN